MTEYISTNPARLSDVVATVQLESADSIAAACVAANRAQQDWASVPAPIRGTVIRQVGRLFESNKDALARLITREVGKPFAESLGEVQEVIDTCDFFLGEGRRLYGQTVPSEMPDKQLSTFRRPVGTAFIITAGNFPAAVPSWYIIPALLCGNSVVWKPAEYSAAIAQAFVSIVRAGGVPPEVFSAVFADGLDTFAGLELALQQGSVQKVGFTGSTEIGRKIGELCGRYLQSPCLELGGKNPLVVMEDADIDLAVTGALFSGFGTAGQRCTSLGIAIVHTDVYEQFVDRFADAVSSAKVGDPDQDVLFGPLLDQKFADRFDQYLESLIAPHHRVLGSTGRGRISASQPRSGFVGDPDTGIFYHPTIVADVKLDDPIVVTETFGPLVGVARVESFDQALLFATKSGYGLSSAIYTNNPKYAMQYAQRVGAGMTSINNSTSGAEAHLPFGGNGKSGNGSRQSGMWVLDQFTRWQAVNWDYSGRLQRAQMDLIEMTADETFRI